MSGFHRFVHFSRGLASVTVEEHNPYRLPRVWVLPSARGGHQRHWPGDISPSRQADRLHSGLLFSGEKPAFSSPTEYVTLLREASSAILRSQTQKPLLQCAGVLNDTARLAGEINARRALFLDNHSAA